jgi:hypothetical protein
MEDSIAGQRQGLEAEQVIAATASVPGWPELATGGGFENDPWMAKLPPGK